jgi:hypothetical protein
MSKNKIDEQLDELNLSEYFSGLTAEELQAFNKEWQMQFEKDVSKAIGKRWSWDSPMNWDGWTWPEQVAQ